MSQVYPERLTIAKRPAKDFAAELDGVIRRKIGELIQAALEAEVDEALQRLKYERSSTAVGYRDGHDPERSVVSGAGSSLRARCGLGP
jgi:transposase-like protein